MRLYVLCAAFAAVGVASAGCGSGPAASNGDGGAAVDGGGATTPDATQAPRLAGGLSITEVAVLQAVQISVARDGVPVTSRNAPVVANRTALVRVFVTPDASWSSAAITGELVMTTSGGEPALFSETETIAAASTPEDISSTFDFLVPADQITTDTTFSVRLVDPTAAPLATDAEHDARYPRDGSSAALGAQSDAGGIEIVLVPVQYDRDGSGRLPDTSPAQLAVIETLLTSIYPLSQVTLTVRAPVPWNRRLTWSGNFNFGSLNQLLIDLKAADGATSATYYYGMVRPADTYSDYCGGSCVAGQAFVVSNPESGGQRVGSGVGYTGERSAFTLAHEVGHMHGRSHTPCGTSSSDSAYPHDGGYIGVWGYDPRSGTLLPPDVTSDLMGYCKDKWISDYTFAALFDRVLALSTAAARPRAERVAHRFLRIDPGHATWGRRVTVPRSRSKNPTRVRFLARDGRRLGSEDVDTLREAHGAAQWILVPSPPVGTTHVVVERRGSHASLRVAW